MRRNRRKDKTIGNEGPGTTIDRYREVLDAVFERPDVKRAEALIMKAIAEAFAPEDAGKPRRRKKGSQQR